MNRLEYPIDSDHKWSNLKLLSKPAFVVVIPFNDGYGVPTVTTDPATGVGLHTATLNGTLVWADGSHTLLSANCGFEYGLDTGYGTTTSTESKGNHEPFSRDISGLLADREYHFRALATNVFGIGKGLDRTFTTLAPVIPKYKGNINVDQLIYQHAERMGFR